MEQLLNLVSAHFYHLKCSVSRPSNPTHISVMCIAQNRNSPANSQIVRFAGKSKNFRSQVTSCNKSYFAGKSTRSERISWRGAATAHATKGEKLTATTCSVLLAITWTDQEKPVSFS